MKDMLGRQEVIAAKEALSLLLSKLPAKTPREISVAIENSLGMICSEDVLSPEDLPHFARSTVDGYAVKAEDTFGAAETMPAYLNISREIFMGEEPDVILTKGQACRIPTGGMLPSGADSVVMFEHCQSIDEKMVEVVRPVTPGENVIQAGEDVRKGEALIEKGRIMRPQHIGACAGVGITMIPVYDRPRVSIISTGDEIVSAYSQPSGGQVRDINSYVLSGMISDSGGVPLKKGIFRDNYGEIKVALEKSIDDSDAIVLSGGTSVGIKDVIAKIIDEIGNPGVIFHGVSLKPGKPMIGGVVNGVPVFGLPGHPAAVSVCFEIFIQPVLKILSGSREKFPGCNSRIVTARLSKNVSSPPGREDHVRASLEVRDDGLWAVPVLGKSGLITTLVKADGTFVIPVGKNGIERGEEIEVRLF